MLLQAGPEFGPAQECVMLIDKELHGLQTSGNQWHAKLADDLFAMGFVPSKADPDPWSKEQDDHYEFIGVFVDDVLVFSTNSKAIFDKS
jgi:hypothetical protein